MNRSHRCRLPVMVLVAGYVCLSTGCASPPSRNQISDSELVAMVQDGVPAATVIEKMQASRSVYLLPATRLLELKRKGVPDEVLDYMEQTHLTEACRQAIWDDSAILDTALSIDGCE